MYNPHFDKQIKMCQDITNKHVGEIEHLVLDWIILEMFDKNGEIFQQPVPKLVIDFKG
jgi:hypothetical protein